MHYRALGATGLTVSEIGFGGWGIGGTAYGTTDDTVSLRAIQCAVARGVTFFDTSSFYGFGRSESLIGRGVADCREHVVIATKAGLVSEDRSDFSSRYLRESLDESLVRLSTDYIDLFQLHSPSLCDIDANHDIISTVEELKVQGKIRAFGVSVSRPEDAIGLIKDYNVKMIQVNFNLMDQRIRELGVLALAREYQTGLIARTPLCFGFLTGDIIGEGHFEDGDHRAAWSTQQRRLWSSGGTKFLPRDSQVSKTDFALNFCLSYPEVSVVIPGMLTEEQVIQNCDASNQVRLSELERDHLYQTYRDNQFMVESL